MFLSVTRHRSPVVRCVAVRYRRPKAEGWTSWSALARDLNPSVTHSAVAVRKV